MLPSSLDLDLVSVVSPLASGLSNLTYICSRSEVLVSLLALLVLESLLRSFLRVDANDTFNFA